MDRTPRFVLPGCLSLLAMLMGALLPVDGAGASGPEPWLRLSGREARNLFGYSVSAAGDVNGDGYGDAIVGAPYDQSYAGRAYLYFGGAGSDSVPGLAIYDAAPPPGGGFYGVTVAGAGDLNGDGYADFAVGAPTYARDRGRVYLYYGGPSVHRAADLVLAGLDHGSYENFGLSVSAAGDLNGDGFADLIVGAPRWNITGRAYVFYGSESSDSIPDLILDSPPPDRAGVYTTLFGRSVACAGDVNGDGHPDLVVTQSADGTAAPPPYPYGTAFVYYGGAGLDGIPDLALRSLPTGFSDFGGPIATGAGDFNGDGFGDIAVQMPETGADVPWANALDSVYVYFGGLVAARDSVPSVVLHGDGTAFGFGSSIFGGKDVNGDGFPDVVVGAPLANPDGYQRGRVFVFYGGRGADGLPDVILGGELSAGMFGWSVSSDDITGDGIADVIVGAPSTGNTRTDPGHVYVYDLAPPLQARAFLNGERQVVALADSPSRLCIGYEPIGGLFRVDEVDRSSLRLVSPGTGEVSEIQPAQPKTLIEGDKDADGITELSACFARADLTRLFSGIRGRRTVDVALEGRLLSRRRFRGELTLTLVGLPAKGPEAASVWPNPLNPQATLRFSTGSEGPTTVRLYDITGRCARTLLAGERLQPGRHAVALDGRDDRRVPLASGVYFYRIEGPDGITQGRFVVAK